MFPNSLLRSFGSEKKKINKLNICLYDVIFTLVLIATKQVCFCACLITVTMGLAYMRKGHQIKLMNLYMQLLCFLLVQTMSQIAALPVYP